MSFVRWEKGQIENQVQHIRQWLFTPKLDFDDLDALNAWLSLRCNELGSRPHPDQKDQTIDAIFTLEQAELRPLGVGFDGYVEKAVRVRSIALFSIAAIVTAFRPDMQAAISHCALMRAGLFWLPIKRSSPNINVISPRI